LSKINTRDIISGIRTGIKYYIYLLICAGIFALISYLSRVRAYTVWYAFFLCLLIMTILVVRDSIRSVRKQKQLREMTELIPGIMPDFSEDTFGYADSSIDREYIVMIEKLCYELEQLRTDTNADKQDMEEYYTMWVHQIKTPISAMRLMLDTGNDRDKQLSQELFKVEQYVEMVLNYQRIFSKDTDFLIKELELDDVIKQAVKKYSSQFIQRHISLKYEPVNYNVISDEKWVLFVLEQLISNGLKYTNEGSISIYMQNNRLIIQDTGIGIQEEDIPRIFDRGYTGFNGRLDKKSTGIGLYLCKNICNKLNIDLQIESVVGEGTKAIMEMGKINEAN
jgi:signal transduction histidine kinase